MKKYKVLFCDLDGTLIETLSGKTFPKGIWDMKFKFDVLDAIKKLAPEYVFIVSNQGGIALGFVDATNIESKFDYVCSALSDYCNISIHKVSYNFCSSNNPLDKDRKPNTGMLEYFYEPYINKWYKDEGKNCCLMIGDASGLEGQFSDSNKKTAENFGIDYLDVNDFIKEYNA